MAIPFRCPVCGGNGVVRKGFYEIVSGDLNTLTSSKNGSETCRACKGRGIIWSNESPKDNPEVSYEYYKGQTSRVL